MAGQEKRVKFVDSAMLQNDVLRPWTIDIHLEKRLQQESSALNKILQFTTPQKFAGTLASSVIDSVPEELRVFRDTLNLKYSRRLSESVPVESPALSRRSEASTRPSSSAPSSAIPRDYDDADLEYIDRMKRSMYLKSMRIRQRPATSHTPINSIHYSGSLLPTASKMLLLPFHPPVPKNGEKPKLPRTLKALAKSPSKGKATI
ncbi:hypothetical protein B484DRAFT_447285 [Ochromonadaceae sp. CCMP2298]|nr:hypothetical protein B484DRAFT_447285 [Ochromonadaceae sp. CCMP2298]